ncbi:MAG: CrcB family protein [Chloroflexi bacterium]|nr:CrcB family protein [Chloroflexota bacterium]
MQRIILVFLGGGIGASLRALMIVGLASWDRYLPGSILLINLIGAFILGAVYVLADEAGLLTAAMRLFVAVGVLGGFTTFSTFGWGTDVLIGHGRVVAASIYLEAGVAGGVLAVGLGMIVARESVELLERGALAVLQRLNAHGQRRHGNVRVDIGSMEAENREGSV